jgi:hypothetical protein
MELTVTRNYTAFGPSDRIEVLASLRSSRPNPLKLRAFHLELIEVITIRPPVPRGSKQNATNRSRVVHEVKVPVGEKIARTEEKKRSLALVIPAGLVAHTTKGGKSIDIAYELSVKAIMEGTGDVKVEHLQSTLGIYGRPRALDLVNQIGVVDSLCPGVRDRAGMNRSDSQATSIRSSIGGPPLRTPPASGFLPFPEPRLQHATSVGSGTLGPGSRHILHGGPGPNQSPQARLGIQPFTARPLSTDSSSIYSHPQAQSQSDVSSLRDSSFDGGNNFSRARPHTFGMSDFPSSNNIIADTKRMSWTPTPTSERGQSFALGPPAGKTNSVRPAGPARTPTAVSTWSDDGQRSLDGRPVGFYYRSCLISRLIAVDHTAATCYGEISGKSHTQSTFLCTPGRRSCDPERTRRSTERTNPS